MNLLSKLILSKHFRFWMIQLSHILWFCSLWCTVSVTDRRSFKKQNQLASLVCHIEWLTLTHAWEMLMRSPHERKSWQIVSYSPVLSVLANLWCHHYTSQYTSPYLPSKVGRNHPPPLEKYTAHFTCKKRKILFAFNLNITGQSILINIAHDKH